MDEMPVPQDKLMARMFVWNQSAFSGNKAPVTSYKNPIILRD